MKKAKWLPHRYQLCGLSFIRDNKFSGLFLDAGLGKTSTILELVKIIRHEKKFKGVLIVAPLRVAQHVWPAEIKKWLNFGGITWKILHGKTKADLWESDATIYLINPEGLPWLHNELLQKMKAGKESPFNVLVIDESTKFKNPTSNRFKLLCDMLPLFYRRHIMTGTPAPSGLINLWSQLYTLDEGKTLGENFYKFKTEFFTPSWNKYSWTLKDGAAEEIHQLVSDRVLSMSSEKYLDMPAITYNDIVVRLPKQAHALYTAMENELYITIDNLECSAQAIAQAVGKCHQIANGRAYESTPHGLSEAEEKKFIKTRTTLNIHTEKVSALLELIAELNGKPLLIAYYYKHDLTSLKNILGEDVPRIGSGVDEETTQTIIKKWNSKKIPVLLGHPASMSHGLNLQGGGNDVCWFSLTWSLEDYQQLNARIYRQGVQGGVRIHHIIADKTIDRAIMKRLTNRSTEQQNLRNAITEYRGMSNHA